MLFIRLLLLTASTLLIVSLFLMSDNQKSKIQIQKHSPASASPAASLSADFSIPSQKFADLIFKNPQTSAEQFNIGLSVQKRPIAAFRIGSGPKKIILIAGLHTGKEVNTIALANQFVEHFLANPSEIPADLTLIIIPNANPDGLTLGLHTNANQIDLNRNWPAPNWQTTAFHPQTGQVSGGVQPLSEPEVRALWNLFQKEKPELVISYHSKASIIEDNNVGVAHELARIYAQNSGYKQIDRWPYYEITGQLIDAANEINISAFDVELASNNNPEFEQNLKALRDILNQI